MSMNKIIFKLWLDAKRSHLNASKDLGILYSSEYIQGQLDILAEIEDSWNLEEVKEDFDYQLKNNF